jgi:hypothetical protein
MLLEAPLQAGLLSQAAAPGNQHQRSMPQELHHHQQYQREMQLLLLLPYCLFGSGHQRLLGGLWLHWLQLLRPMALLQLQQQWPCCLPLLCLQHQPLLPLLVAAAAAAAALLAAASPVKQSAPLLAAAAAAAESAASVALVQLAVQAAPAQRSMHLPPVLMHSLTMQMVQCSLLTGEDIAA